MTIVINNRYKNRNDICKKFLIFLVSVYSDKIITSENNKELLKRKSKGH